LLGHFHCVIDLNSEVAQRNLQRDVPGFVEFCNGRGTTLSVSRERQLCGGSIERSGDYWLPLTGMFAPVMKPVFSA
jgi:hypothetical protein